MRDNNLKREFHWFLLTDYEVEEELLRKKHQEGYQFESVVIPGIYTFRKCEPEDVIYRLDFHPLSDGERDGYLQIFRDYGWEYIAEMNDYSYFRKSAKEVASEEEAEIFCDSESRLDMMKKIFWAKMVPILLIFFACGVAPISHMLSSDYHSDLSWIFNGFWAVLFLLYLYVFVHCAYGFYKLRKKYSHE